MTAHLTSRRIRDLPFPSYPVVFFYARARSDTKKNTRSTERCAKIADPPSEETDITLPPSPPPLSSSQITQRDRKNEPTNQDKSRYNKTQQDTRQSAAKQDTQARHTSKTQGHTRRHTETQTTTSTLGISLPKQE